MISFDYLPDTPKDAEYFEDIGTRVFYFKITGTSVFITTGSTGNYWHKFYGDIPKTRRILCKLWGWVISY